MQRRACINVASVAIRLDFSYREVSKSLSGLDWGGIPSSEFQSGDANCAVYQAAVSAKVYTEVQRESKEERMVDLGQFYTLQKCLLGVLGYSNQILQCRVESWEM